MMINNGRIQQIEPRRTPQAIEWLGLEFALCILRHTLLPICEVVVESIQSYSSYTKMI